MLDLLTEDCSETHTFICHPHGHSYHRHVTNLTTSAVPTRSFTAYIFLVFFSHYYSPVHNTAFLSKRHSLYRIVYLSTKRTRKTHSERSHSDSRPRSNAVWRCFVLVSYP